MDAGDAAEVLSLAAAYDNRKPGEAAARAWALALPALRLADAKEAVVEHYQRTTDFLMPYHLIDRVRELRERRAARFTGWQLHIAPPQFSGPDEFSLVERWKTRVEWLLRDGLDIFAACAGACEEMGVEPTEQIRRGLDEIDGGDR